MLEDPHITEILLRLAGKVVLESKLDSKLATAEASEASAAIIEIPFGCIDESKS